MSKRRRSRLNARPAQPKWPTRPRNKRKGRRTIAQARAQAHQ